MDHLQVPVAWNPYQRQFLDDERRFKEKISQLNSNEGIVQRKY